MNEFEKPLFPYIYSHRKNDSFKLMKQPKPELPEIKELSVTTCKHMIDQRDALIEQLQDKIKTMFEPEVIKQKDLQISKLTFEKERVDSELDKLKQKLEKIKVLFNIPDIENKQNSAGYKVGYHLDLLDTPFVMTAKVLDHFRNQNTVDQKDFERKQAQLMTLGASLINKQAFNSLS